MGSMVGQKRVAVIGAGASGIIAIEQLTSAGVEVTAFEARDQVGGAWLFDPHPGECSVSFDEDGNANATGRYVEDGEGPSPATPMYIGLCTNVPTTLMQYREAPFPRACPLFPDAREISSYLQTFAAPLKKKIRLSSRVTRLRHSTSADARRWTLTTTSTLPDVKKQEELEFDAVVVANGHYSEPWIPFIPGLATFSGTISHAKWYRDPEDLLKQNVLVVGNSASGYDITREISQNILKHFPSPSNRPRKIYQSIRSPGYLGVPKGNADAPEWVKEIKTCGQILRVDDRKIYLDEDEVLEDVDHILFATGYLYSYPFAQTTDAPFDKAPLTIPVFPSKSKDGQTNNVKGGMRVHHLDERQMFYLPDPTLSFLCLNTRVIPFPLAEAQSHFIASFLLSPSYPHPSPSFPLLPGTPEDAPESRSSHVFDWPREHDYQDALLRELGEGEEGFGNGGESDGRWRKVPQATRDLRMGSNALRRAILGY